MLSSVNNAAAEALGVLSGAIKVGSLKPEFSVGWNETTDRAKGYFESSWGNPKSWREVILQGPYFHVATPFATERNESMLSNHDYSALDLEVLPSIAIPATEYKPIYGERPPRAASSCRIPRPTTAPTAPGCSNATTRASRSARRRSATTTGVMWRRMAATTGERTLIPAIYPPGAAMSTRSSLGFHREVGVTRRRCGRCRHCSGDFVIRSTVSVDIHDLCNQPTSADPQHRMPSLSAVVLRTLRLNCLTDAYAGLWRRCTTRPVSPRRLGRRTRTSQPYGPR